MNLSIVSSKKFPNLPGFSGIEYHNHHLYVISDSSSSVYIFECSDFSLVDCINLNNDGDRIVPKSDKNDLESISFIDDAKKKLLILGSGSKAHNRDIGYLVNIPKRFVDVLNLHEFYEKLALIPSIGGREFLNIESLHIQGKNLYLGQRGNTNDSNGFIVVNKNECLKKIRNKQIPNFKFQSVDLPKINTTPGGISGSTFIDSRIYLIATYEQTNNTYDDGLIIGSKLMILNKQLDCTDIIDFPSLPDGNFMKIESICSGANGEFYAVSDQDEQGSLLLSLILTSAVD